MKLFLYCFCENVKNICCNVNISKNLFIFVKSFAFYDIIFTIIAIGKYYEIKKGGMLI